MSSKSRRSGRVLVPALVALALVVAAGVWIGTRYRLNDPVTYESLEEHYKYGSIGGDVENGLPLEVVEVLPEAFPEYLPEGAPADYTAFGFIQEPGRDMPIGFSERQHVIPRTGMNCAPCHVGLWRDPGGEETDVILGMPAVTLDITAYFEFLFAAADDPRFGPDYLLPLMEANGADLSFVDRQLYARVILPRMRDGLLARRDQFAPLFQEGHPPFGPGRVDTFNPYKVDQLAEYFPGPVPEEESIGTVDYPAIWNQGAREGMALNWDGNSPTIRDRNMGAAFGAGATRESIDIQAIQRVTEFLADLPAPAYPWGTTSDEAVLGRGEEVWDDLCASCHAMDGAYTGEVVPLEEIGTDPYRVWSYTDTLNALLLAYGEGYGWKLTDMVNTDGYANQPLDGIWARAPYLHNGSVPTLYDLLTPEEERNGGRDTFWVGSAVYDTVDVGVRTDVAEYDGREMFLFDLTLPGNGNQGHSGPAFGTELSESDKRALIEYMKTLR